ncbi:MAG: hypothetical protein WAV23_04515 [Minisyncoccia bacterium]
MGNNPYDEDEENKGILPLKPFFSLWPTRYKIIFWIFFLFLMYLANFKTTQDNHENKKEKTETQN